MTTVPRRTALKALASLPILMLPAAAPAFSFDRVRAAAADRAGKPWQAPVAAPGAAAIGFDRAGAVRFDAARTLLPQGARIRLLPTRDIAPYPLAFNVVDHGVARPVTIGTDWFTAPGFNPSAGASGFRAVAPSGTSDWLVFQGASYFRAAGAQDQYGLSARAVVVDTGLHEEFPAFTDFWLEQAGDGALVVHALLDGPSLTGAFRFVCRQSSTGVTQQVDATLFLRRDIERLGLAPATSMFWVGENDRHAATDWRPEIHDSDGLAIVTGAGERLWRPLDNPARAIVSSFADDNPAGYGLLQRDRLFDHYQDDGTFYERRPNLWVTPHGKWGKGAVALYAFPTAGETQDNVVAYWAPDGPHRRGARLDYGYRLDWSSTEPPSPLARSVALWTGAGGIPGGAPRSDARKLVFDFVGRPLAGITRASGVAVDASVTHGRLVSATAYPVARRDAHLRAMIEVAPAGGGDPADVRLALRLADRTLTETVMTQVWP